MLTKAVTSFMCCLLVAQLITVAAIRETENADVEQDIKKEIGRFFRDYAKNRAESRDLHGERDAIPETENANVELADKEPSRDLLGDKNAIREQRIADVELDDKEKTNDGTKSAEADPANFSADLNNGIAIAATSQHTSSCFPGQMYYNLIFAEQPAVRDFRLLPNVRLTSSTQSLVVYIKGSRDGLVMLSAHNNMVDGLHYEVVIGAGSGADQFSQIKKPKFSGTKVTTSTPFTLDANEYRPFWISWNGGLVRAGRGTAVGSYLLVEWRDPSPHNVNYLGVGAMTVPVSFVFQYD